MQLQSEPYSGPDATGRIAAVPPDALNQGQRFVVGLRWPALVVSDAATGSSWAINAVEACLLSAIDGKKTIAQLILETRIQINRGTGGRHDVDEAEIRNAFVTLLEQRLLTNRSGQAAVARPYAALTEGSLGGALAVLLARNPDFSDAHL